MSRQDKYWQTPLCPSIHLSVTSALRRLMASAFCSQVDSDPFLDDPVLADTRTRRVDAYPRTMIEALTTPRIRVI
jgi:hypothetical protein